MCGWAYEVLLDECKEELEKVENVIKQYERKISELNLMRLELISRMRDIDMGVILECIEDNGLTAADMVEPILDVARKKVGMARNRNTV